MKGSTIDGVLTGFMAGTAMAGSIAGLVHFAGEGKAGLVEAFGFGLPLGSLAFVAGIDGLAIALTRQVHRDDGVDWVAAAGLALITLTSMTLQILAVSGDGWKAWVVHGVPAPCAGVAAAYFFRNRGRGHTVAPPPPPVMSTTTGALTVEGSASGPVAEAEAAPPLAPEVPPAVPGPEQRRATAKQGTRAPRGRSGRGRSSTGPAPDPGLEGDELATAVARKLMEKGENLTARNVEQAVRDLTGTCSKGTRDAVYAALTVEEAMSPDAPQTAGSD